MLTNLELDRQSGRMSVVGLRSKRERLSIDISRPHFETAFRDFTNAAEHFAMHLSDALDRKFVYQYLGYLQEVTRGSEHEIDVESQH